MISRRRTNTPPNEVLQQASITGASGIDITRPITANNIADKIVNFDLDHDGSLILRKPLIEKESYNSWISKTEDSEESIVAIKYLYDKKNRLLIIKNVNLVTNAVKYALIIANEKNNGWFQPVIRFTDITGKDADIRVPDPIEEQRVSYWNLENPKIFNTNTSTIIGNCTVDLTADVFAKEFDPDENIIHEAIYNPLLLEEAYAKTAPRYLQIFYEVTSEQWVVRVVTPEMNTLEFSEDIIFNPNTTLDASYALRDNYFASLPTVKNITAYAGVLEQNKKLVFNPDLAQTNIESPLNNVPNNVPNPQYWNPNSYNINNAQILGFHISEGSPRTPRIKWVFTESNRIPRNAVKSISFAFNTTGQVRVWDASPPIPANRSISTTVSNTITGTFESGYISEVVTRFNYNVRFDQWTPAVTDVTESGEEFLNVCINSNGSAVFTRYNIAGTGLSAETWWQNCGWEALLTITLKNDTSRTFKLAYGQNT